MSLKIGMEISSVRTNSAFRICIPIRLISDAIASTSPRLPTPTGDASPIPVSPLSFCRNNSNPYRIAAVPWEVSYGRLKGIAKACQEISVIFKKLPHRRKLIDVEGKS